MAWEPHLSAQTGFSSSLIGSEVPAEQWWSISRYVVHLVTYRIHHSRRLFLVTRHPEKNALTAAFSGANDLGAGGSACDLSADALRGRGERRRGVLSRQRRCAGERSVEVRHIVPHHPTSAQNIQIRVRNPNGEFLYGLSCGSKPVDPVRTPNRKKGHTFHLRSRTDLAWPSAPTR